MARIRTIKPSFFTHEGLADLPFEHRLCFIGLWTLADNEGRMEDRPRRIAVELFPYDRSVDLDAMLNRLEAAGFIIRYEVDGSRYLAIPSLPKHQRFSGKEAGATSEYPPPPTKKATGKRSVLPREAVSASRGSNGEAVNVQEGKGREGKGREEEKALSADADRAPIGEASASREQPRVVGFVQSVPTQSVATGSMLTPASGQLTVPASPRLAADPTSSKPPPPEASPLPRATEATSRAAQAREVFAHWQQVMGHPTAKFGPERERPVLARLKDGYAVADLKRAIEGCSKTPHNMGQNDRGQKYDDLELICRTGSNVERFMRNAAASQQPQQGTGYARNYGRNEPRAKGPLLPFYDPTKDGDLYGEDPTHG